MATDDDDDPSLRSMRSMWLSMPDEEPPARGLDALMAAARVKAEEMAKPSLWQRFTAAFTRPPVLAFATVLVLVGGAVFVGTRKDEMDAQAPATQSEVAITQGVAQDEKAPAQPVAPAAAPEPEPVAAPASTPVEIAKAPPAKRPARAADTRTATKSASPPKAKAAAVKADSYDYEGRVGGAATGAAAPKAEIAVEEPAPDVATTKSAAPQRAEPADREPTVVQLHKRALAAAARGDCESARTAARRIQSQDVAYYKSKIAGDSALRACLVED